MLFIKVCLASKSIGRGASATDLPFWGGTFEAGAPEEPEIKDHSWLCEPVPVSELGPEMRLSRLLRFKVTP